MLGWNIKFLSSLSVCGSLGTPSMADLTSHHFLPFNLECQHHATGQIDEIWNGTIGQVTGDQDGTFTSAATLAFAQLYRVRVLWVFFVFCRKISCWSFIDIFCQFCWNFQETCCKMCSLVRDVGHFLSMTETFREISGQFSDALHILMRVADCPFIFVASQIVIISNVSCDDIYKSKWFSFKLAACSNGKNVIYWNWESIMRRFRKNDSLQ